MRGRQTSWLVLVVLGMLVGASPAAAHPHHSPLVRTHDGAVRGERLGSVEAFRGIPYAAPPVGARRFEPPAPVRPWRGVLDATGLTPPCPQRESSNGPTSLQEDCLQLDVWRPRHARRHRGRMPVLFWIHGGGYANGSASQHDPSRMVAQTNTIVVVINYRLGAFGWLADRTLDASSGDAGFLDQQAALRWVRTNIRRFGGNRRNVTIDGESAGGWAVCEHLTSPGSRGLFAHAVIQSGWCPFRTRAEALEQGDEIATALGCADLGTRAACLRSTSPAALLDASQDLNAMPVLGGPAHPIEPLKAIDSGRYNRVPVVMGNTRDEFKFVVLANPDMTQAELRASLATLYPGHVDAVLAEYAGTGTPADTYSAALNDPGICGINDIAGRLSRSTPVWFYEFDDQDPPPELGIDINLGAYHSSELQYLFGFRRGDGSAKYQRGLDAAEQRLSDLMIGYWGAFAHRGDPNHPWAPRWPRFVPERAPVLRFAPDATRVVSTYAADHHCGFWRSLGVELTFRL
jgi:para-nitrobenzyl esterase